MAVVSRTKAIQGEIVRLTHTFIKNGVLTSPSQQPLVEILDQDGETVIESIQAQMESPGVFYADYFMPDDLPLGKYYDRWIFQQTQHSNLEIVTKYFEVKTFSMFTEYLHKNYASLHVSDKIAQMILDLENDFIYEATHIPVYNEKGRRITEDCKPKYNKNSYVFHTLTIINVVQGSKYFINGMSFTIKKDNNDNLFFETYGSQTPPSSGTLIKVSGDGPSEIIYNTYDAEKCREITTYDFAFCNWNEDRPPVVRVTDRVVESGYSIDYQAGRIHFERKMTPADYVDVSYHFSLFKKEELVSFLRMGLHMMNSTPPASITYREIDFIPREWQGPILLYAAQTALRRMILGLSFQEKQMIYGKPEQVSATVGWIQSLYNEYKEQYKEASDNAKTRKLYSISVNVIPSYTLPGGRSRWFRYMFKR